MKIKRSKSLNKMMEKLFDIDDWYVDDMLTTHATDYTVSNKTPDDEAVEKGFNLALLARELDKPVYEVAYGWGDEVAYAYFLGELNEIKKIFVKQIKLAKEENEQN